MRAILPRPTPIVESFPDSRSPYLPQGDNPKEFSGVAGQLRYYHDGGDTFVSGDVNGDGIGDFLIGIAGEQILVPNDFFL